MCQERKIDSEGLVKFWQSIINKENIVGQLIPVLDIEDCEERTFKLLCQTLFLLVMDMKQEQDERCKLRDGAICRACQEKLSGNDDETIGKEELPAVKNTKMPKTKKIADKTYRNLSRSSPPKKALCLRKRNEVAKEKDKAQENLISPHIIVHETLSLDENPLHVNVEKRKVLSTQTVMIPETLAMDFTVKEDDDADFFDASIVSKENTSPEDEQDVEHNDKLNTPVKDNSLDSTGEESPILGKQNKSAHPRVSSDSEKLDIPKKLEFENLSKLEPSEPVVSEKNDVQITSMPRYSPLVFTNSPSVMHDETDLTSPSILPGASSKNSESVNIQDKGSPFLATLAKKPPFSTLSKAKKCLQKSASSFNVSPKEKVTKFQRHHTLDNQPKQSYEICLEPPGQQSKKNYRQTKISAESFLDKKKMTGKKLKGEEEDEGLRAAMMESLKSKMVEDMMRKKEKALQGLEYGIALEDEDDRMEAPSTSDVAKVKKRVNKEKSKRLNSPIKLPKLSPTKHVSSPQKIVKSPKILRDSPIKKRRQTFSSPVKLRSSPRKQASCSTRNLSKTLQKEQTSPRKRQAHTPDKNNQSSPKKRRTDDPASHTNKERRVLAMDQLLKEVNDSPVARVQSVKQEENCTGQRKIALGKNKKQFFDNSFDIVPTKNVEPNYAYQGEVVRKKEARKNLEGWDCHECKEWYENQNLDPEEKKRLMNKCSRHRSKHNPVTNTPENFWDPGWVD